MKYLIDLTKSLTVMNIQSIIQDKIGFTILTFLLTTSHILWDYFHGGVPIHNVLAREDLPAISNWWGLLTIPLLTWIVISLIQRRKSTLATNSDNKQSDVSIRFFGALIFGISISIFWHFRIENILQYLILLPIGISLFKPVHFPESLLGFVLGMFFTFGGVLPIMIGLILLTLSLIINTVVKFLLKLLKK